MTYRLVTNLPFASPTLPYPPTRRTRTSLQPYTPYMRELAPLTQLSVHESTIKSDNLDQTESFCRGEGGLTVRIAGVQKR